MIDISYIKLAVAALLPVLTAAALFVLDEKTSFRQLNETTKQLIYGLVFSVLAIIGTEWGIPLRGAQVNCRDAAVLVGGLMFGAPAGIIAGVVAGMERWIAVAWGVGTFTRVACTLSTMIAGLYAAVLRKFMFQDKRPGWLLAFAIGVVMEVFHITMVFVTNMATPVPAMAVVRVCTVPMVSANGLSVMMAALVLSFLDRERLRAARIDGVRISQTVQRWLLLTVTLAFAVTSFFVFRLQTALADSQTDSLLTLALEDVTGAIQDTSDQHLLTIAYLISDELSQSNMDDIAEKYDVAEISRVNDHGIITESTVKEYVGFDMASGIQSADFLRLLHDTPDYVQEYGPITSDPTIQRKYAGIKTEDGFLQVGIDAQQFQRVLADDIVGATNNRHVGQSGYLLILDKDYQIVSCPEGIDPDSLRENSTQIHDLRQDVTFSSVVNGVPSLCRMKNAEGYCIISVLPQEEAMQLRNTALYVNTFLEILVFALLFALIYLLIKRVVVNRLESINLSLAKIADGDLDEVVDVRSNAEFSSLSDDINSTVSTLKRYIDEASARIDKELELAKTIQLSALPRTFPAFPKRKEFDIYASTDPAKEVGGDFYDFYLTGSDTLNFLIADVSGKGIGAAMFMMRAKTELKRLTEADLPLDEVFTHGNDALCEGNDAGMFVTAWQGSLDLESGLVRFANAGHNPPLVRHADGSFAYLKSRAGFVLAGMDGIRYKTQEMPLQPGDTVYLYTDGVTEATNAQNELFGEDRLLAAINSREFEDMQALCRFIRAEVDAFVGDAPQFDDITMVALRYFGKPAVPSIHFDHATVDDIPAVTEFVEGELTKIGCPMKTVIQFSIAIDEIYSNIVKYGYRKAPGPVTVQVIEKDEPHRVFLRFMDEGVPYNPLTSADPDVTLSAEERDIGGLGIFMVKKSMDDMKYKYENDKNILTIMKTLDASC